MTSSFAATGPLRGLRVLEFAGLGPGPFAAMLLSDMGADVVQIARPGGRKRPHDAVTRGRTTIEIDLKDSEGLAAVRDMAARTDVLIEGFRPGVMERLGLGPVDLLKANPKLVYGRMTGWGQTGPLADKGGHDINYIAVTGVLSSIGEAGRAPALPLNLVGDYGGGALYLVVGLLAAIIESKSSGKGQVVDCAICDGAASLMSLFYTLAANQQLTQRGSNQFDGGAHFYAAYECADGKFLAVGAGEPKFYAEFRQGLGLDDPIFDDQRNRALWPELKQRVQAIIRTRSRDEWVTVFEGQDACVTPVLSLDEAPAHPHLRARQTFVDIDGATQPAPAPRFSRSPSAIQTSRRLAAPADLSDYWV